MMTDKELLEAAAMAAGFQRTRYAVNGMFQVHGWHEGYDGDWEYWDPLTDDGDALRLAVKLNLMVDVDNGWSTAIDGTKENDQSEPHNGDPYAATRRVIVRAAEQKARGECLS